MEEARVPAPGTQGFPFHSDGNANGRWAHRLIKSFKTVGLGILDFT